MATVDRKVVDDCSSSAFDELRRQFNLLLDAISDETDLTAIKAALTAGTVRKVVVERERPVGPRFPNPADED